MYVCMYDGKRALVMYVAMYVCMYVCTYVCFSQIKSEADNPLNSTLLRHKIIGMRCLTDPWRVILAPTATTQVALSMCFSRELRHFSSIVPGSFSNEKPISYYSTDN